MGLIIIRGIVFPEKVKGVTVTDPNGDFNVYINIKLSEDEQQKAAAHELRHIELDHLYDSDPVIINELEAG